ncbi:MAG: hypothetical protein WBZ36_10950 [Candidatus Nitrosopolaris sp.]
MKISKTELSNHLILRDIKGIVNKISKPKIALTHTKKILLICSRIPRGWPLNPQSPYPATPDGSIPIEQQIMLDP